MLRTVLWKKDQHNTDRHAGEPQRHNEGKRVPAAARLADRVALARPDIAYSVRTAVQRMAVPDRLVSLRALRGRNPKQFPGECWCYAHRNMLSTILCCSGQDARESQLGSTGTTFCCTGTLDVSYTVQDLSTGGPRLHTSTKAAHPKQRRCDTARVTAGFSFGLLLLLCLAGFLVAGFL